ALLVEVGETVFGGREAAGRGKLVPAGSFRKIHGDAAAFRIARADLEQRQRVALARRLGQRGRGDRFRNDDRRGLRLVDRLALLDNSGLRLRYRLEAGGRGAVDRLGRGRQGFAAGGGGPGRRRLGAGIRLRVAGLTRIAVLD